MPGHVIVGPRPAQSLCHIPGRISARRLVRAIARRRSALVAESRGRFGNAASVRARRRAPGRGYDTGSQQPGRRHDPG
ncbi:hypothetical protein FNH04_24270 [Streptomyces phyllanthi]|uniref:Uncharacterized protein n=1 Tax=Streptomyces phyllanthi TaxID=1803180 RepID=A0A5N8W5Z7_9ACTN|nr:hypothetical protein [Streptomyces phyllanthi]